MDSLDKALEEMEPTVKRTKKPLTLLKGDHPLHQVIRRDSRAGKAIAWWAASAYAYSVGKDLYERHQRKRDNKEKYIVTIDDYSQEELHRCVIDWLFNQVNRDDVKSFEMGTVYQRDREIAYAVFTDSGKYNLNIAGHDVVFDLNQQRDERNNVSFSVKRNIIIKCESPQASQDVTQFIIDLYAAKQETTRSVLASLYSDGRGRTFPFNALTLNGWRGKDFRGRIPESVILHGDDKESLFADIENFLEKKDEYTRIDIPWHRGYLFHGPPGTGKTSLAVAVASFFEIPVYYLPLSLVTNDAMLSQAISNIDDEEAVLILEDIDIVKATHQRSGADDSKRLTLAGLLDALDGMSTPSGLITIMTTNDIDSLDDALIRPGRVDMKLDVGYIDDEQLHRMLQWYIELDVNDLPPVTRNITPAQITDIVKRHIGFPDKCVDEIKTFLKG